MSSDRAVPTLALALLLSVPGSALQAQEPDPAPGCWIRGERSDLELRASPFDSAAVTLEAGPVKVCYSRPRKLGRPIMGRLVPFGEPWRLGANEATAIHVPTRASIAGVRVEPGWYSLYVVPQERRWRVIVNSQARRWGIPIDADVTASDVGQGSVDVSQTPRQVELLTLRFEPTGPSAADLVVEWADTSVRIPIVLHGSRSGAGGGRTPR